MKIKPVLFLAIICCVTTQTIAQNKRRFEEVSYFPRSVYAQAGDKVDSMGLIWTSVLLRDFRAACLYLINLTKDKEKLEIY